MDNTRDAQGILLESGTNEVEILEFFLGGQSYGINVSKILQIISFEEERFTRTPDADPAMPGVLLWREKTLPFIDLYAALNVRHRDDVERPIALVTEFNDLTCSFLTDGVNRIHRIGWDKIDPLDGYMNQFSSHFTGSVHVGDKDVLLVDFEYLVANFFPETKLDSDSQMALPEEATPEMRSGKHVVLAEDSPFIRHTILTILQQSGYTDVQPFENGLAASEYLNAKKKQAEEQNIPVGDMVNLIITDIEMPQLDGLTLCRRIKEDPFYGQTPVIIFSSLINEQMAVKCREVGADAFITKPRMVQLVGTLDNLLFELAPAEDQGEPPSGTA
ncbi:two-component system, chemotaxis family, response regulator CheV [Paucidesulfovibrio gracilis DSM 16080]|uniref:Two-component system, chemotaxis family, response regulator CheV n=1 Tax=Paucidesulfovibrio gracilis DSM 16080 TaxID=1121449 RepID=A0A1T4XIW8_9BACT|nr:chemotaxis protein CheV [Paucidesulfovibrio gracilis]SKA89522.1 two-component system, chemotaxis family, response regulator CheV [Paucidesulfovibrio gracilis DSM 16080]